MLATKPQQTKCTNQIEALYKTHKIFKTRTNQEPLYRYYSVLIVPNLTNYPDNRLFGRKFPMRQLIASSTYVLVRNYLAYWCRVKRWPGLQERGGGWGHRDQIFKFLLVVNQDVRTPLVTLKLSAEKTRGSEKGGSQHGVHNNKNNYYGNSLITDFGKRKKKTLTHGLVAGCNWPVLHLLPFLVQKGLVGPAKTAWHK